MTPGGVDAHAPYSVEPHKGETSSDLRSSLPPSWLELKKGTPAYTTSDSVSVCGTAQEWLKQYDSAIKCAEKSGGVPVTIASDEIVKWDWHTSDNDNADYGVFIRADDASWSGWIGSNELMPRIPPHTKLMVATELCGIETCIPNALLYADQDDTPLTLDPNQAQSPDPFVRTKTETLNKGTIVELILQDPKNAVADDLYIDRGAGVPNALRKGWLNSQNVSLPDDRPLTFQPPIGYAFKSLNVGSSKHGTPITEGRLIGSIVTIDTTVPGCNSQDDMDRLEEFAKANDSVGLTAFVTPRLATGKCVLLLLGDSVRIDATDNVLDHFCVRPKDQARCFWTLFGAMTNSLERLSRISPTR
jgi:hypothetical protein